MRFAPLASALALAFAASNAAALTEPNGLQIPVNSSSSGEEQLSTLFTQRGETINWQTDAHVTPNAFSPLCGFTATYVLNQAGSHFGLAWYNETGAKPAASDLHVLVPANSAVGTMFTGTTIKSDPAYLGGQVGFALMGGETHYTNDAYDTVCTSCNPQAPWITALMYASTATPNAYYICFEDGGTSAGGWNNDGDFNDDVFFLTGITCSGGGQPCDTGKSGVCAAGLTQCTATGTMCQQLTQPAKTETCNGLDDDCNGIVDDGAVCPTGEVCEQGTCVQSCSSGEFTCPPAKVCNAAGYCVDPACKTLTCPAGQVCVSGTCKAPCDGVVCPASQVCREGVCLDPCAGVTCPTGEVCNGGVCVTSCSCLPCATSTACNATSGLCVDPACATMTCASGTTCKAGTCVDDCTGAVCPTGETCKSGQCVASPTGTGGSTSSGVVFGGVGGGGGGTASGGHGGAGGAGNGSGATGANGGAGGTNGSGGGSVGSKSNCGCRVAGEAEGGEIALVGLALAMAAARRRRR